MDREQRETANRLFTQATVGIEDALEAAVAGQSPRLTDARCRAAAARLQVMVSDIAALAAAALVIVEHRDLPRRR
jgi:hypothetical protein